MLRRDLLAGLAASAAIGATAAPAFVMSPRASVTHGLEDALLSGTFGAPAAPERLRRRLTAAEAAFREARYTQLGNDLPLLLRAADATVAARPTEEAHLLRARALNVATQTLVKFDIDGLSWVSADRALGAARASGDPLAFAEATRLLCIVARRGGHGEHGQRLAVTAANELASSGATGPRALGLHAALLSTAGYTAARRGGAAAAATLLAQSSESAARCGADTSGHEFAPTGVAIYRVSAALAVGDPEGALGAARSVRPVLLGSAERRGRFLVDVASAHAGLGQTDLAFAALNAAERAAPEEVRARPVVRRLAGDLLDGSRGRAPSGLRAFAARVGASL